MKKIFTLATAILASFSMWADITWTAPQEATQIDYYQTMDDGASLFASKTKTGSNVTPEQKEGRWSIKSTNSGGFWLIPASDITKITGPYLCSSTNSANIKYKIQSTKFGTDLNSAAEVEFEVKNSGGKNVWHEAEMSIEVKKDECIYVKFPTNVYISQVILSAAPKCNAPEKELVLKADKEAPIYVGDEVTFSTEGGNSNTPVIAGDAGEEINAGKWIATEGQHTFTAKQEAEGEICAQEAVIELTVLTKNPVESAEVTGPANCYVGTKVTLTCTAANATEYQWYNKEGIIADATADTYEFTPEVAGEYGFYCTASNEFNSEPVRSNSFIVTVEEKGKVEGLIIKATANQEVSGPGAGTVDTKISKAAEIKLNKGNYFGVQLADGFEFAEGDIFVISITTAADLGKCMLFADKAGTELIYNEDIEYSKESPSETGEKQIILPAAVAGKTSLYLYRTESIQWNPTFNYIAVYRGDIPSAIENTEASVKAVKVIRDGQLYIMHNGRMYNVQGAVVK